MTTNKKDIEFDWDEKEKNAQESVRTQNAAPIEKKKLPHGMTLAIPVGKKKWKAIDIALATSEEFVAWVKLTYPVVDTSKLNPLDFSELSTRLRSYENIIAFHKDGNLLKSESVNKTGKKIKE